MQLLVKIAIVAVVLTASEGAENHADDKVLLSQQVANHLRGASHDTFDFDDFSNAIKTIGSIAGPNAGSLN